MANVAMHREKIVQAAIRLFREKGYAATGLNEILKLSGAPKGSLYYYFPAGKQALAAEAVSVAGSSVKATLEKLASIHTSPSEFVAAYCDLLCGWMQASNFKAGCPITTTVLETVPSSAAIATSARQVFSSWVTVIADVFVASGFTVDEATERAEFTIAAIEGALIQSRVESSAQPINRVAAMLARLA